jgi:CRP/FNR family transcriptional regulator, anaerobic regulatory protein
MQIMPSVSGFLPFWGHLTAQEKQLAESSTSLRHFACGASLYNGGFDCMGLVYVLSGGLRVYMMSDEGREITLYRLNAKDICLLTASCVLKAITFEVHVDAGPDTELSIMGAHTFETIMQGNVHVEAFAYKVLAERFSQVMFVMQQMLFKRFDQRLAAFLLEETEKTGSGSLKITHEQIARYMGSAREVVTRMLKYFTEESLVSLARGEVAVLDRDALKRLA